MLEYCVNQAVHGSGDGYGGDSMQKKKKLPIGIEFFLRFQERQFLLCGQNQSDPRPDRFERERKSVYKAEAFWEKPEYGYAENILRNWCGFVFI